MLLRLICVLFLFANCYANTTTQQFPQTSQMIKPQTSLMQSSVLKGVDDDLNKLNALKRQLEIKKATEELNANKATQDDSQTVAIGIVINKSGNKIATLQFIDGSTLDVEIGSNVDGYKVYSIDMSGVKLSRCFKHKCSKRFIKRAYPQQQMTNKSSMSGLNNHTKTKPTPIFSAEVSNSFVPPIIAN